MFCLSATTRRRFAKKAAGNALARARRDNIAHDVDLADHLYEVWPANHRCPRCNVEMGWQVGQTTTWDITPNVDKIIPSRGYVHGNVEVVCGICNNACGDSTSAQELARRIAGLLGKANTLGHGDIMKLVAKINLEMAESQ